MNRYEDHGLHCTIMSYLACALISGKTPWSRLISDVEKQFPTGPVADTMIRLRTSMVEGDVARTAQKLRGRHHRDDRLARHLASSIDRHLSERS